MTEEIRVDGLEDLKNELRRLPEKLQGKALQGALAKAAKPIVATARSLAPVKTGRLRKAIYSFRDRSSTRTREARLISVKSGKRFQKKDRDAYYWKFIEFGRAQVTKKGRGALGNENAGFFGKTVKAIPPRPFMRPAFEQNKYNALQIVQDVMKDEVTKVAKRAQSRSSARLSRALRRTTIGI